MSAPPFARASVLLACLVLGAGCGAPARHASDLAIAPSIAIAPPRHVPYAGTSIPLVLRGTDDQKAVQWSTAPSQAAWVTSDGVVHLYQPGRVTITARVHGMETSTELTVRPNPVTRVEVRRRYEGPLFPGDSLRIEAIAYAGDTELPGVRPSFALDLRGSEPPRARVSPEGVFVADAPGTYTVLVEVNAHGASVPIVVRPSPDRTVMQPAPAAAEPDSTIARAPTMTTVVSTPAETRRVRLAPTSYDAYTGTSVHLRARVWIGAEREPAPEADVTWGSSDSAVAMVDADGVVTFRRRGWVRLSATYGGKTDSRRILVRENPVAHVVLQSNARYPRVGEAIRLREEAWQRGATPVPFARSYYGIVAEQGGPGTASISEDRVFTASEPGVYTVVAVVGERASKTTFVVYPNDRRCELQLRRWDPSCRP